MCDFWIICATGADRAIVSFYYLESQKAFSMLGQLRPRNDSTYPIEHEILLARRHYMPIAYPYQPKVGPLFCAWWAMYLVVLAVSRFARGSFHPGSLCPDMVGRFALSFVSSSTEQVPTVCAFHISTSNIVCGKLLEPPQWLLSTIDYP